MIHMTPGDLEKTNVQRLGLYSQLFIYGDFIPLNFRIDTSRLAEEIKYFDSKWVPYNAAKGDTGRVGLSVTSLDGGMSGYPDLQSLYQYSQETGKNISENSFDKLTEVYDKIGSISEVLDYFKPYLGRSRFVKFSAGGYFPPHRDQSVSFQVPDYFRIFVPLTNSGENKLFFIYDGKVINYEPGRCYLFNALKVHTVFSTQPDTLTLALSLKLSQESVAKAIKAFEIK